VIIIFFATHTHLNLPTAPSDAMVLPFPQAISPFRADATCLEELGNSEKR